MASSNPQRTGGNHLYFEVHDRIVQDSGTDMSFDNHDVRDQSFQPGNGQIRRMKPKQGSSGSRPGIMKHNAYSNAYISPYIQEAELRARERTRQHTDTKKKQPRPGWNSETSPRGNLFDPTLKKQEIFKLGPRKVTSEVGQMAKNSPVVTTDHSHSNTRHKENDEVRVGKVDPSLRPKMTMRSSAESFAPLRTRSVLGNSGSLNNSRSMERVRTSANGYTSIHPRGASRTSSGTSPRQSLAADSMQHLLHPGGGRTTTTTAGDTNTNNGTVVTRSTSPINSQVIESILQEDGIVNDDDYTIHFKTFQKQPGVPNHHLNLGTAGPYIPGESAPVRNEAYYTEVLRHRLRDILLDRNDEEVPEDRYGRPSVEYEVTDCEDLNTSEERGRRRDRRGNQNNYAERKYLRSKSPFFRLGSSRSGSRGRSCDRNGGGCAGGGATEELMNSMAQIMSAVGSIVTKQSKNPFKAMMRKEQRRLLRQERRQARSADPTHRETYARPADDDNHHIPSVGRKQRTSTAPASSTSFTIGLDGHIAQQVPSYQPLRGQTMLHEIPRSKTHMLNVIMAKLEAIERSEQQIQEFLQSTSSSNPSVEEDQLPRSAIPSYGGGALGADEDEIDRHLHGVRPSEASFLPVYHSRKESENAPRQAVISAGEQHTEQSSMLAHVDSDESDFDADHSHTNHTPSESASKKKATTEQGTQDSAHTLAQLQQHLRHAQEIAARGPSLATLQQQEEQQRVQSAGLTPTQLHDKEVAYLKTLPKLPRNETRNEDIFAYMRELDHCRELKDVAFRSRGVTMAQVADRMTEEICEQLVASVAGELDHYIDDYSEKFLDKI